MIIDPTFLTHYKTQALVQLTGEPTAPLGLVSLWGHCQTSKAFFWELPEAELPALQRKLAMMMGLLIDRPEILFEMLEGCGWIDVERHAGAIYVEVHGFEQMQSGLVTKWKPKVISGPSWRKSSTPSTHQHVTDDSQVTHQRDTSDIPVTHHHVTDDSPLSHDTIDRRIDRRIDREIESSPQPPAGGQQEEVEAITASTYDPSEGPPRGIGRRADEGKPILAEAEAFLVHRWNAIEDVTACRTMTNQRRDQLRRRLKEPTWRKLVAEALEAIAALPFYRGQNDQGWRASMDWFLKPDSAAKLVERAAAAKAKPRGTAGATGRTAPTTTDYENAWGGAARRAS